MASQGVRCPLKQFLPDFESKPEEAHAQAVQGWASMFQAFAAARGNR